MRPRWPSLTLFSLDGVGIPMNTELLGDVLFCLAGVYISGVAYGWFPPAQRENQKTSGMLTRQTRLKIIGPVLAFLGLIHILLHSKL
jgi:hypothetical protein